METLIVCFLSAEKTPGLARYEEHCKLLHQDSVLLGDNGNQQSRILAKEQSGNLVQIDGEKTL